MSGLVSAAENGAVVPIFIQMKDVRGLDMGSGTQGYIAKPAGMTRGNAAQPQEWMVTTERLDLVHIGGA